MACPKGFGSRAASTAASSSRILRRRSFRSCTRSSISSSNSLFLRLSASSSLCSLVLACLSRAASSSHCCACRSRSLTASECSCFPSSDLVPCWCSRASTSSSSSSVYFCRSQTSARSSTSSPRPRGVPCLPFDSALPSNSLSLSTSAERASARCSCTDAYSASITMCSCISARLPGGSSGSSPLLAASLGAWPEGPAVALCCPRTRRGLRSSSKMSWT
mmetsp:Transcript_25974/g.75745  ORF Transcript_25974/g.75745 Transcript_25974/m.75745 type:complete len:219 (+) Transcript_25974:586-1242(+)